MREVYLHDYALTRCQCLCRRAKNSDEYAPHRSTYKYICRVWDTNFTRIKHPRAFKENPGKYPNNRGK